MNFNELYKLQYEDFKSIQPNISQSPYQYSITADLFTLVSKKLNFNLNSPVLSEAGIGEEFIQDIYDLSIPLSELTYFFDDNLPIKKHRLHSLEVFIRHLSEIPFVSRLTSTNTSFSQLNFSEQKNALNLEGSYFKSVLSAHANAHRKYFKDNLFSHPLLVQTMPTTKFFKSGNSWTYETTKDLISDSKLLSTYFKDR